MEIAQQACLGTAQSGIKCRDVTILRGFSSLAIMPLLGIYFCSTSSGTALADFASKAVFP
jgi:hypothetical protein